MNKNTMKVLAALRASEGRYIDDHNGKESTSNVFVVYVDGKGEEHLCWAQDKDYFCLNPMVLAEDGTVHLSRWSVGSVLKPSQHGSLEAAVEFHNDDQMDVKWNTQKAAVTGIIQLTSDPTLGEIFAEIEEDEKEQLDELLESMQATVEIFGLPKLANVLCYTEEQYLTTVRQKATAAGVDLDAMAEAMAAVDIGDHILRNELVANYLVSLEGIQEDVRARARKYATAA